MAQKYPKQLCVRITEDQFAVLAAVVERLEGETGDRLVIADGIRWLLERGAVVKYARGQ